MDDLPDFTDLDMVELGGLFAELEELQRIQEGILAADTGTYRQSERSTRRSTREARLYIGFEARLTAERVHKYGHAGNVQCTVELQGSVETCPILLSPIPAGARPAEKIFEIHEYYGLSELRCSFHSPRLLGSAKMLGYNTMTLRDIVRYQSKHHKNGVAPNSPSQRGVKKLFPSSDSIIYWGFEHTIRITDPSSGGLIDVLMYGRYVPLSACQELRKVGDVELTELHLAVSRAPQHIVEDLLAALSREGVLAACLRVRCRRTPPAVEAALTVETLDSPPGAVTAQHETSSEISDIPAVVHIADVNAIEKVVPLENVTVQVNVDTDPDTNELELTPLEAALQAGNLAAAKSLLQRAGNLCFEHIPAGKRCNTPIHSAVRGGDDCLRLVMRFLIQYTSRQSWSLSLAEMLESRDKQGRTPLMLAALLGRPVLVGQFLKMSVNAATATGDQPCFKTISKCGSVVIGTTASSSTLHQRNIPFVEANETRPLAERVMNRVRFSNLQAQVPDHGDQWTALMYAATTGSSDIVKMLLETVAPTAPHASPVKRSEIASMNCAPCARSRAGLTALMIAAEYGRTEVVLMLLLAGIPMHSQSRYSGETALHIAASGGHFDTCKILITAESVLWGVLWGDKQLWNTIKTSFEKTGSSGDFRGNINSSSSPRKKASNEHFTGILGHMRPKYRFISALNFRGIDALTLAERAGYSYISNLIIDAVAAIYYSKRTRNVNRVVSAENKQENPDCKYITEISERDVTVNESSNKGAVVLDGDMKKAVISTDPFDDEPPEAIRERDSAEHMAYIFALAAVPRTSPPASGFHGFSHIDMTTEETDENKSGCEDQQKVEENGSSSASVCLASANDDPVI